MQDMPYIDALIAAQSTSCDEPNAAEWTIAFDASLERSGWAIVPVECKVVDEQNVTSHSGGGMSQG